jgi:HlyD family secretion protein
MKSILAVVAVVALIATGVYFGFYHDRATAEPLAGERVTVELGSINATVSAIGNIRPHEQRNPGFRTGGQVAEVLVDEGDSIEEGEVLARLDTTELEFAVAQAEATVSIQEARLRQLESPVRESDLRAAEAALANARASLERLEDTNPDDTSALEAAQAQVAAAESALQELEAGPGEDELAAARANLRQAQVGLEQARYHLDGAELVAPFDGLVATVHARSGEMITGMQPMVTVVNLRPLRIQVEVDEVDVGQVQAGNPVSIVVDSLPDVQLHGRVAEISSVPTVTQGVVTYTVRIPLEREDIPELRVGMTANVEIITETVEQALLVPNRAVEIDRQTGQLYVERITDDTTVRTEVQVGLRSTQHSQILQGVQAGDVLLIRNSTATPSQPGS